MLNTGKQLIDNNALLVGVLPQHLLRLKAELAELGPEEEQALLDLISYSLDPVQSTVINLLHEAPLPLEDLCVRSGFQTEEVEKVVNWLEQEGVAEALGMKRFFTLTKLGGRIKKTAAQVAA